MIDLSKQYRTEEGYEVKLSFINGEEVYGHYKSKWGHWVDGKWSVNEGKYVIGIWNGCHLIEIDCDEGKGL